MYLGASESDGADCVLQVSVAEKYSRIITSHQQKLLGMYAYTNTGDWTHLPFTLALHAQWSKLLSLPPPPSDARGMCPSKQTVNRAMQDACP